MAQIPRRRYELLSLNGMGLTLRTSSPQLFTVCPDEAHGVRLVKTPTALFLKDAEEASFPFMKIPLERAGGQA